MKNYKIPSPKVKAPPPIPSIKDDICIEKEEENVEMKVDDSDETA